MTVTFAGSPFGATLYVGDRVMTSEGCGDGAFCFRPLYAGLSPGTYAVRVVNGVSPPLSSPPASLTITPGPPVVGTAGPRLLYAGATRTVFAIAPPAPDVWTRYELRLDSADGWVRRDASGARPAKIEDLRGRVERVRILGAWGTGAGAATLDNFAVELAR